ncbi:TrmH family RNA methyltransferase [Myceligenerans crystallogenes]|uniref:RNA methyltransferase n=1 Tax=Myceligenerans crystallogenes TaxID=316335 RepID=A0ABN2NK27_9MICO
MTDDPRLIDSPSDPEVQRVLDVSRRSKAATRSLFIEDVEPVQHAVRAGLRFTGVYALESAELPGELLAAIAAQDVPFARVTSGVVSQMFKGDRRPPEMFAIARTPPAATLDDVARRPGDVVVLDGAKIVGNIGAIIRSAYGLGAAGVVLVGSDLDSVLDRRVVRASRGYVFSLPVVLATPEEARGFLVGGPRAVALDAGGELGLADLTALPERLALVLGGEKTGHAGHLVNDAADIVSIPMHPEAESLNVSVVAGIALAARTGSNLA